MKKTIHIWEMLEKGIRIDDKEYRITSPKMKKSLNALKFMVFYRS